MYVHCCCPEFGAEEAVLSDFASRNERVGSEEAAVMVELEWYRSWMIAFVKD